MHRPYSKVEVTELLICGGAVRVWRFSSSRPVYRRGVVLSFIPNRP